MPIEPGQQLLHYRMIEKIGEGGMGQVWLALDTRLQRKVAVKFPSERLAADNVGLQRFKHEATAAAAIDHPFVCKVYEVGRDRGVDFIAMEYVEGATLSDELKGGALLFERALRLAEETLDAVAVAHERGVVHRDLKPANVMLAGEHVKVMDFGLARRGSPESDANEDTVTRLTQAGATLGTIPYMSPEQLRGEDVDPRSDLFVLGVMFQEMLTGTHPFERATSVDTAAAILNAQAPPLRQANPKLPPGLQPVLDRLLAKQRDARFASAAEALKELRGVRAVERAATDAEPPRRRKSVLLLASLAVAVAVVASWALFNARGRERARALLPEIEELAAGGDYVEAYRLAKRAERKLGADPDLNSLWPVIADRLTLVTEPPGASVQLQAVPRPGAGPTPPVPVGTTPIQDLRLARADYRATIELAGYAPAERMISSRFNRGEAPFGAEPDIEIKVALTPAAELPHGMVFVPGGDYRLIRERALDPVALGDYYVDTFEVRNRDFVEFVQGGGYSDPSHWPASMRVGGREKSFSEAVRTFTDRSGLQAPRGWSNQQFPGGRDDHPVTGVTWYEAAAYCAFHGKSLPDVFEWERAARGGQSHFEGAHMPWGQTRIEEANLRANFLGTGTDPVDSHPFGISPHGAYNMAGNVEEWLANPRKPGYATVGGSWTSPAYSFHRIGARPADHAHGSIGFRCVQPVDATRERYDKIRLEPRATLADREPVDDDTFQGFLSHYRYDPAPANAEILERVETVDWVREKIAFDGVGGDRALAYLWLPQRSQAPFQIINYVVSSTVLSNRTAAEEVESILAPQIKSGRAVFAVVPKGFVERPWDGLTGGWPGHSKLESVGYRDEVVLFVTEFRMGLDYLETRDEIDATRIAHAGFSWGAVRAAFVLVAVEPRIRSTVFIGGGSLPFADLPILPEANPVNFAPRVRSPVLMINGLYDEVVSAEAGAKPMFALLPEPKRLELLEAGHLPELEIRTPIINRWLDETLGPVDSSPASTHPVVSSLKIAVLPFVNASGDPAQEYFSAGLTSEIVTELSRYEGPDPG